MSDPGWNVPSGIDKIAALRKEDMLRAALQEIVDAADADLLHDTGADRNFKDSRQIANARAALASCLRAAADKCVVDAPAIAWGEPQQRSDGVWYRVGTSTGTAAPGGKDE